MSMINLKELEESLTPEQVIQLLQENFEVENYTEKSDCIIFPTFCHHEDVNEGSMKLYYYKKNHRFVCYTQCGCTYSIYSLFKQRYELLDLNYNFYKDIVLKIAKKSDNPIIREQNSFCKKYESKYSKLEKNEPQVNFTEINPTILNCFTDYYTTEWLTDGVSIEAMKEFNIKYSIFQNKIIIPHYDIDGKLIGIRGRALNPEEIEYAKYMPVQIENTIYKHPLGYNLYGLNKNKDNIKRFKMAIVAESEKAVCQYETMFGRNNNICVASCGSSFHDYQFELLQKCGAEKILIAFDNEGTTQMEREKYFLKLKRICNRYKARCKMGFIYDSQRLLKLKESPFDRGKEIFKQLYKKGVWL